MPLESDSAATTLERPAITPASPQRQRLRKLADLSARYGIQVVFFVILTVLLISSPLFRSPDNLLGVLQQSSIIGVLSCGMLVIIIAGAFDLSFGAIGVGASVSAAAVIVSTGSIGYGLLTAVLVGLTCGLFNGFLVTRIGITPFVATLGSGTLITGIVLSQTGGRAIAGLPLALSEFGLGRTLGIPNPALVFALAVLITWFLLHVTRFGHFLYAVGSSKEPARLAGVAVDRVLAGAFVFGGLCAGIAGILLLSQTNVGQPTGTETWALNAIAAVVVGGTPLRGGMGGVRSVVLGALLLGVVSNALNLYGVSPYWQPAVTGTVILLAVGFDAYQRKSRGTSA